MQAPAVSTKPGRFAPKQPEVPTAIVPDTPASVLGTPIMDRQLGIADAAWTAGPGITSAGVPVPPGTVPLAASIALGVLTAFIAGAVLAMATYTTHTIWFFSAIIFGVFIGIGFHFRSRPETWRIRSCLAGFATLVSLFLSNYFLTRALAIDTLTSQGRLRPASVPLFLGPADMLDIVGSYLSSHPTNYFVWAFAIYIAYTVPSATHRNARKAAKKTRP